MRLHFEADLDYQRDAIDAVCDLFRGQESYRGDFSVLASAAPGTTAAAQGSLGFAMSERGVGNRLSLTDYTLSLHDALPISASRCRSAASATGCR